MLRKYTNFYYEVSRNSKNFSQIEKKQINDLEEEMQHVGKKVLWFLLPHQILFYLFIPSNSKNKKKQLSLSKKIFFSFYMLKGRFHE